MFVFADAEHRLGMNLFCSSAIVNFSQKAQFSKYSCHSKGPDDADYVQVVHTDGFARGVLAASGHQDFYMNGGIIFFLNYHLFGYLEKIFLP